MRIELRTVGMPAGGRAEKANAEVSTETDQKPLTIDLPDGSTVEDLLRRARELGVAIEETDEVLLDGHSVDRPTPLRDGAAVTLIGQVHGL